MDEEQEAFVKDSIVRIKGLLKDQGESFTKGKEYRAQLKEEYMKEAKVKKY